METCFCSSCLDKGTETLIKDGRNVIHILVKLNARSASRDTGELKKMTIRLIIYQVRHLNKRALICLSAKTSWSTVAH